MQAASLLSGSFQGVLAHLPGGLDLDVLALSTKAIERCREISDGTTLLRLALARGPGGLSLNETVTWAAMQGLAKLSDPGLKYRLDKAVPFLKAVMEQQLAERSGSTGLLWPGRFLRATDGTTISQHASKGSDWRVHATFDLGRGGFSHLELTDKHGAESFDRSAPIPGEVRIGDRNYANARPLHDFRVHSRGLADFIVRVRWKSFSLSRPDSTAFNLIDHLRSLPVDDGAHEVMVEAKVDKKQNLPLRLIIVRRTAEETAKIRHHLRRSASRKQKVVDHAASWQQNS